jgi:hypothetical protein
MQALKNAAISAQILAAISEGKTVAEAMDAVLGAGTYAKLRSELYEELRAKAGK